MLKDPILTGKEKLKISKKINYERFLNEVRTEISKLLIFYNYKKIQKEKNVEKELKKYLKNLKEKYKGKNDFLESLFFDYYDSYLILSARKYEEKFNIIKTKIASQDRKYFEKIANKYDSQIYMFGTMLDSFAPAVPWDLWRFSNIKELENGFIRYYEKFAKLTNQELERKNHIESLKNLGFKYSKWTNTYLKVFNIEQSLTDLKGKSLYDIHDVAVELLIKKLIEKKIVKIFSKNNLFENKAININSGNSSEKIYIQSLGKFYLDDTNSIEILKFYNDKLRAYALSVSKIEIEKLFNFLKQAYLENFEKKEYFNFSSYNSLILNQMQYFYKENLWNKLFNKDRLNISEIIKQHFKVEFGELFLLQNIISTDYSIKKINLKEEYMELEYEAITYPYLPTKESKIKKIICEQTISFNNLKIETQIKGFSKIKYYLTFDECFDFNEILYGYKGNTTLKEIYEAPIPYDYIHLPKNERYFVIKNYALTEAKFKYVGSENTGYGEITD